MDALACTAASFSVTRLHFPSASPLLSRTRAKRTLRKVSFAGRRCRFRVLAAKDEPTFDKWDLMELKFGRFLGEDPKLTLAKIMGRKANPDASYIEIEKSFYKNKGKIPEIEEVPFDLSHEEKSSNSSDGLNLVRPVPKKGIKFKVNDNPVENPVLSKVKKTAQSNWNGRVPNVILRKPTMINEDDVEDKPSRFRIKPNLSLRMSTEQAKDKFSDMTLLRKPEPLIIDGSVNEKQDSSSRNVEAQVNEGGVGLKKKEDEDDVLGDFKLVEKLESANVTTKLGEIEEQLEVTKTKGKTMDAGLEDKNATESKFQKPLEVWDDLILRHPEMKNSPVNGMQPKVQKYPGSTAEGPATDEPSDEILGDSSTDVSVEAALKGKPKRLDQSVKETSNPCGGEAIPESSEDYRNHSSVSHLEDFDWTRMEDLVKMGEKVEVELISCSTRGFVVSFGSLIGFLPYGNLNAKRKFLAFESWLRQKGLDPSTYRQTLGVMGSYDAIKRRSPLDSSLGSEIDPKAEGRISPDMKLDNLLRIYDQEKLKFLSSFVGQKMKANVVMADRKSRKLVFSLRPKEKEELVEKKRDVMAKLRVGDVVKCSIKKITYFGIFVEVDGVPALVHQTEVSWDATLDPASYFKIGQIVEAKVHQLDYALERIFLSLKEITPDPLMEALESVVGDHDNLGGRLQAAQPDTEWADVESLIKELQQIEGVQSVSKGRFFLSPGLAPTFQVYMASMFENQYKLLARAGNKVQEVIVQASLGKEEMKSTILSCTNRVE